MKKKRKAKSKKFLVCPSCGSADVHWLVGGQTGDQHKCVKCGYQGIALRGNIGFIKKLRALKRKKTGEKKIGRKK
ncbi:MAG: hypothetical protein NTW59_00805 [Candidatus Diapherotrites archaeon]|nr:hypothetical protein [Candidatus Diapherotrites archaeon]